MGGNFGESTPDRKVYILNTSEPSLPTWEEHPHGTPSSFADYQATGAVGSMVYVFGGNTAEADWQDNPLRVAQASTWYEAATPRKECRRVPYVPSDGMCAGTRMVIASCADSVDQLTSRIQAMHLEEANQRRVTAAASEEVNEDGTLTNENGTLAVAKGPAFYHTREQCQKQVSSTCMLLLSDVVQDPLLCSTSFHCLADSLYTSWYMDGMTACGSRHNSQCSNAFTQRSELCCDVWMALQQMNCLANLTAGEEAVQEAADAVMRDATSLGYCFDSPVCYSLCPNGYWLNNQGLCRKCTDCVSLGLFPAQRCSRLADALCIPLGEAVSAAKHKEELVIPKGR
jgi:hypothetical protein